MASKANIKRNTKAKAPKAHNAPATRRRPPKHARSAAGVTVPASAGRAPAAEGGATAQGPNDAAPKQRWRDLAVHELRALYEAKVGRSTESTDRAYLILKIRAAEKGLCRVGPRAPRVSGPTTAVTILFGDEVLAELDTTAQADGFQKRLPYLRTLFSEALAARGHAALAERLAG